MDKPRKSVPCGEGLRSMSLTKRELTLIELFRSGVETLAGTKLGLSDPERHDRDDHWIISIRWLIDQHWWLELIIRPTLPQVRVGVVTDDQDRCRDVEKMIVDSSLNLREFIGLGFKSAGLNWAEPLVERFREGADRFCFATPLDLSSLEDLTGELIRDKILKMLDGYHQCFTGRIAG
jgi:hypothetical protein